MKKIGIGLLLVVVACASHAQYAGGQVVARIRMEESSQVFFGTQVQPPNTCSNWGEYFWIDTSTQAGRNMFNTVMLAKLTGKQVELWFNSSSAIGKDQSTGCTYSALSKLTGVSVPANQ